LPSRLGDHAVVTVFLLRQAETSVVWRRRAGYRVRVEPSGGSA
jgi:hypothetical protein